MDFVYETAFPSDREPTGAAILEFVERVFTRKRTEFEAKGGLKVGGNGHRRKCNE